MGCSSSSAQTVDQEKKPGTKPEESNGGPLAVRNGIIAETIEDKTQLCESALADDLQQAADDGTGAALVVTQGHEDLSSGQDLMTELEPQPDPFSVQEPGSAAGPVEASSDSGFADVAVEAVEPQMVKSLSVEEIPTMGEGVMEQAEVHSIGDSETCKTEVPVLKDDDVIKGEVPAIKEIHAESPTTDIEPVRADVPAVVELASVVPAWASPEAANSVAEPVGANMREAVPEVPDEVVPFLETASESSLLPPALVIPESPASTESAPNDVEPPAGATAGDASVEYSTTAKSPEAKEAIIDTGIAVATIPEMPPLVRVRDETEEEQRPTAEESNEPIVMPSEIAQRSEPSSPTESTTLQEPALVAQEQVPEIPVSSTLLLETSSKEASEFSSTFGASPSSVTSDAAQPAEIEIEANSPVTAADQASEASTEDRGKKLRKKRKNTQSYKYKGNRRKQKMSAAKVKMRQKKLRNQPASVQCLSSSVHDEGSPHPNGGGGDGPSGKDPLSLRKKSSHQETGWVRGHQKSGEVYANKMPQFITAGVFARARAAEVSAMLKAVTKTTGSCHVFGALPRHMRRRAMSHNTKRLPCRLREMANRMREKCLQGSVKKKEQAKNKSRKARRRHGNMLLEFNRRQRKNVWLETHIWHAKRFHMVKKWGYCLGDRPTLKCYRPSYRAMSTHCLLQDLSYYCCLELQGEEDKLLDCLSQLTSKEAGPTFAQRLCLSGQRQGSLVLYRAGQFPSQPLGSVTFLWRPRTPGSVHRHLWTWVHPTLKQDVLTEFQSVCQCQAVVPPPVPLVMDAKVVSTTDLEPKPERKHTPGRKRKQSDKDAGGPLAKKILGDGTRSPDTPVTWKSSSTGILINDLTMEIVRYRLIGPQSHSVLTEALEAATDCDESIKSQPSCLWWPNHCKEESKMKLHQQQTDLFHTLKGVYSTAELPPGIVLGLTVDDPRLSIPPKRVKALSCVKEAQEVSDEKRKELSLRGVPEHCCESFLWEQSVRNNVTENKISEQDLNRMRSEVLVPGSRLSPVPLQGRVPILLVHQPGKQVGHEMNSWGAGWDLLLPKGWGMAFWIPLVYRDVRIGGLKMSLTHSQNKGVPHFPHDYPDCPAGARFQGEQESELLEKFKRLPPAKRTNYIKHGCLAPFCCPWQQLAEEWDVIGSEGGIQAQSTSLGDMAMRAERTSHHQVPVTKQQTHFTVLRTRKSLRLLSSWCGPTSSQGQRSYRVREMPPLDHTAKKSFLASHGMSLVWVRLSLLLKGKPDLHAMVSVPTADDLKLLSRGGPGSSAPQEPPHRDHLKSTLKRGKKGTKKVASDTPSTSGQMTTTSNDPQLSCPASDVVLGVWPNPLPSVTSHCSRVTLGWVTQADFSLSAGCGEALGFVSVTGLIHTLISQPLEHRGTVLLRNPMSLQYRFAKINIEV